MFVNEFVTWRCTVLRVVRQVEGLQRTAPTGNKGQMEMTLDGRNCPRQTQSTTPGRSSVKQRSSSPKAKEAQPLVAKGPELPTHRHTPELRRTKAGKAHDEIAPEGTVGMDAHLSPVQLH